MGPSPELLVIEDDHDASDVLTQILHRNGLENIPIILLSGLSGLPVVAATLGIPYYLGKPCAPEVLIAAITQALRLVPREEGGHAGR